MSTSKRIAKRLLAVVLTIMMLMSMVTIGMASASAASVELVETGVNIPAGTKLYLTPNANWKKDGTRFAAYFFGNGDAWVSMTAVAGETDLYEVTSPAKEYTNVIFCRMNPANTTNNWTNKWNQTADLVYDGTNNRYTVKENTWDKGGGTWSLYVPADAVEVPAAPTAATVVANNTYDGTGTEADPYLVEAGAKMNLMISATAEATGIAYNVDYTASKVDVAAGTFTVLNTNQTAPALDEAKAVNVYVWAYNKEGNVVKYSDTYTTATIYVKGVTETVDPSATTPVVDETFTLDWAKADGLYAYAGTEVNGTNAWQRWHEYNSVRNFFVPASGSDTEVIVYSTYSDAVLLNGVVINPGEYATVPYVSGTTYTCSGATTQKVTITKTDAEGTIFVNSVEGMTTINDDANETESTEGATYDIYAFLTGGTKNREAKAVGGAVASAANGVNDEALIKKIKGRGNTTWSETKKPFNITYDSNIEIDGMKGKKWSLLANAKDGSLLRNRLVYDMANEVEMTYACDSRFVDFFVNGYYKGSYQLTQKIEMGKNTVMPDLEEPEVEDVIDEDTGETITYPKTDFDFILELDTEENAANANDKGFNTTEGQWMTYKTPDDPAAEQIEFIKAKYQAVEDALYGDDMATLETLVDLDDLAKAYLINEISKNIDSGVTSCYFTYNSTDGKFYASPVWDYDNSIGNLPDNGARTDMNGNVLDLDGPAGWYAKGLKHYARNARSVFSEAWYNTSKTADGKTFADIVADVWAANFADLADKLEGTVAATGRLKTVDGYMENLAKSGKWNYTASGTYVDASWKANTSALTVYDFDATDNTVTASSKNYDESTFEGQAEYAGDWLVSRLNWMAAQYADAETTTPDVPDGYITVFFTNNWAFESQNIYYWGGSAESMTWPGKTMTFYETNGNGEDVYFAVIPADVEAIIFNGISDVDHTTIRQTADIKEGIVDRAGFYCVDETDGKINVGTYTMPDPDATEPATTTVATETTSGEGEVTSSVVATDPSETVTVGETTTVVNTTAPADEKDTITLFFTNNWTFESQNAYYWGGSAEAMEWPGVPMEFYKTNESDQDVYYVEVPADIEAIIFNGISDIDHTTIRQTVDIKEGLVDRAGFYCLEEVDGKINVGTYTMPVDTTTTPVETTTVAATGDEEEVTSSVATDTTAPVETTTVVQEDVVVLAGSFNDWDQTAAMTANGTIYTATYTLEANDYTFKVIENGTWLGNDGSFVNTCDGWTMKDGAGNCTMTATGGTYTFTYDITTHKMTVTATDVKPVTYAITWAESDTYTVATDLDATAVEQGTDFTFTVDAADGYKVAAVIVDMETIAADENGVYTIADVAADTTILIITTEDVVVPEVMKFTVTFADKDGNVLKEEVVEYGKAATAPDAPAVDGYTFTGWDTEYDYVTKDITVKAEYKKNAAPHEPATTGKLQIEVSGGTKFTIAVNDGAARPQGTSYLNTKTPIGSTVTVVASTTNDNAFVGWMNEGGAIVSTSETYTFSATGNDYFKAMYITAVEGVNLVTFKNAKAASGNGQIIDMQYYAAGDEIVIPDGPTQAGYIFTGWDMTAEAIAAAIKNGEDVTVSAVWEVKKVYIAVDVTNGAVTENGGEENGKYLANRAVTVTADAAPSGQKFAYWTNENGSIKSYDAEYKFYPAVDTTLIAVYVAEDEEIVYQALADIAADPSVDGEKISYTLSWNVPASVGTYKSSGLMVVNKADFNADTFYHGTTDTKVFDRALSGTALKPQNTYSISKGSSYYDNTYVAATWVQYEVNGETVTIYSDFIEVTKLG